jgi:hypothetical protein
MSETPPPATEPPPKEGPTALQLGIAAIVLGSSAGFTLYTKKAGAMITAMNRVSATQLKNRPPKFGPPTKQEWEKMKPRIDPDEFY